MVLIYAELENPHEGIDRMTGEFTVNQLVAYVNDRFRNGRTFSAMLIRVEYRVQTIDPDTERSVMLRISRTLDANRKACVFRQSDDEFVVIYPNREQMEAAFEDIHERTTVNLDFPARLWYTLLPDSSVLNNSDEFIRFHHYLEKNMQGLEVTIVDDEAVAGIREYLRVQSMIGEALEEGRVEVFFQPIYNVAKKQFTAAEALVRIRDLDGSLISPGIFIPIAEENGMIVPLGEEIFRQVCEFLATGAAQRLGLEYIEVNLSVVQFDEDNPSTFVQQMMGRYGVEPSWINLEITETASNSERRVLQMNMSRLIKKGVHFSLDDFGTGRSNLDYFVDMPVDIIKFDFSFTQGYFESEKARLVVESVVDLMTKMGLPIVAEGVESKEQLDAMIDLGIAYIQGFYFSRPVPRDEFLAFLSERNGVQEELQLAHGAA
jgi:EAL domain-containing protein (putative c-di-GMP-specific phosphodiesterase class I)